MLRFSASALALVLHLTAVAGRAETGFVEDFSHASDDWNWVLSNYAHASGWIDTRWDPNSVARPAPGRLELRLTPARPDQDGAKPFVSGELRRRARSHYGRYEVVMKAAKGSGLNTAFFTYTGTHMGDPHDEIDMEILGRDTTKIWLNYYVGGDGKLGRLFDLGFDAAEAAHHYAFEWTDAAIRWYANGRLLYETTREDSPPPQTAGQVYLSLWAGSPRWLGEAAPNSTATAIFQCVAYSPDLDDGPACPPAQPN